MNEFCYENQGTNTFLVYEVLPTDTIDTMSLGMITNNRIEGLATTIVTQLNATQYIKYDVSAMLTVSQFFVGLVNRKRLIGVFSGIVNALIAVEDYMITTIPATWDETPLNVAFEVMKFFGLKSVIGLNSNNRMTGILTETDFIAESEIISERTEHSSSVGTEGDKWSWDSTSVLYIEKNHLKFTDKVFKDVAIKDVVTANTKTKVSVCAEKMRSLDVEQLPVLGIEGELVGLVRASDLIKTLL